MGSRLLYLRARQVEVLLVHEAEGEKQLMRPRPLALVGKMAVVARRFLNRGLEPDDAAYATLFWSRFIAEEAELRPAPERTFGWQLVLKPWPDHVDEGHG